MPIVTPYRTLLSNEGRAAVSLYNGDPGVSANVLRLVEASGGGLVNDSGPNLPMPNRTVTTPTEVLPNTAVVTPDATDTTAAPATKLSLKGIKQWVQDNPAKAVVLAIGGYLVLRELFKKGKR